MLILFQNLGKKRACSKILNMSTEYAWTKKGQELVDYNKKLVEEYPFLLPKNRFTGEAPEDYDYTYTEMDAMPDGWRVAFGDELLRELKEELVKYNFLDKYRILQIKEKYGSLRWYDAGVPQGGKIYDIIGKYENLSYYRCLGCGAEIPEKGLRMPLCKNCRNW
jgi:hypothetical protein